MLGVRRRSDTAVEAPSRRVSLDTEALGKILLAGLNYFRPADGWATVLLLALNLMVVVWSVEQADWVPTPNLVSLILLAMLVGLFLARLPLWGVLVLPLGLLLGLGVIVAQITAFRAEGMELANAAELWQRLYLWYDAARTGSINIDREPFAFGLMVATWLAGYLAAWVFFRHRNFWGVFILGGAGLLSNLTYLPAEGSIYLGIYLFTALLLVARVQAVRRLREWRRLGFQADSHLPILSVSDSVLMAFAVLLLAFLLLPTGSFWQPAHNVYEYMRSPLVRFEDDFNRLFAGLPARRPLPYRIWGDVMAFQGTINPTTTPVLQVDSPVALYWKARSYGTYTPKGWVSDDTVLQPPDWTPRHATPQPYAQRFEVTHSVTLNYPTRNLFAGGQVLAVNREVQIETYDSPQYALDFTGPPAVTAAPRLNIAALRLERELRQTGRAASRARLAAAVPAGFQLADVRRQGGQVQGIVLAETLPEQPDTLSLRSAGREFKRGETYAVTASVSQAEPEDLRLAGLDYPTWALAKYTQLPPELPQRVRDLGAELTAGAETPYDKAKAVEAYLKTLPYSLTMNPPPYNSDGVDHFLFNERRGYSEYFASAMTVLLRTQGIPARMVTGYTVGQQVPDEDIYIVADSNSHGWVEVFFPGYGWIGFEPTPGASIPIAAPPVIEDKPLDFVLPAEDLDVPLCDDDEELDDCEEEFLLEPTASPEQENLLVQWARQYLPWLGGVLAAAAVIAALGWLFWRRYLTPSADPPTVFRRLAFLGRLNAVGPAAWQTPYQYMRRLQGELPAHREPLSIIVNSYVRHRYGGKETSPEQAESLTRAWLQVRRPLLFHLFRRRNRADEST